MKISDTIIQQIKDSADIVEIIGSYVQLKKRGRTYLGLCPFHHEKTPSFHVNPAIGIYKCFGCGAGGDVIHFLMEHEKYSYTEALLFLAEKYNIPVQWQSDNTEAHSETESLYIVNQFAQQLFTQQLWETEEGKKALEYLYQRGLKTETIQKFQLGYAMMHNNTLLENALKKQYELKYLLQTGLVKQNETTQQYYDAFKGRIIFPIHTPSGKIAGFGGRILVEDKKTAKYINSNESAVYHKGSLLYGLYFARTPIRKLDEVILTEGYFDVISLHQAGIENVIATSGTAFTEEQAQLLLKQTKNITLFYDGDTAGKSAFIKTLDILLPYDAQIKTIPIPDTDDPDSFIQKHTPQEIQQYIHAHKADALIHKFDFLYTQAGNDPNQRTKIQENVLQTIALIPNPIRQQEYVYHIAQKTNIAKEHLFHQFQFIVSQKKQDKTKKNNNTHIPTTQNTLITHLDNQEKEIVRLLLLYGDVYIEEMGVYIFQILEHEITDLEEEIKNTILRQIYATLIEQYKLHHCADLQSLIHHEDKNIASITVELLAEKDKYQYSEKWLHREGLNFHMDKNLPKSIQSAILYLRRKNIDALIQENMQNIQKLNNEGDTEKIYPYLQIQQNLMLIRNNILHELGIVIT